MTGLSATRRNNRIARSVASPAQRYESRLRAGVAAVIAGALATGHHWYGALAYASPWRMLVSMWIPALSGLVLLSLLWCHKHAGQRRGIFAARVLLGVGVIFQAGFSLFEAGYSHALKLVLFYAGASATLLDELFPAPTYHLPDNFWFELTGVLQLVGLWAAWLAWKVFKQQRPI